MDKQEWATLYAKEQKWRVMPIWNITEVYGERMCSCPQGSDCHSPGKHPMLKNGVLEASSNTGLIKHWFHKWPTANLALACGIDSDILVIDIDSLKGGNVSYANLATQYLQHYSYILSQTGNGFHLYFKNLEGIKNKVGLMEGVDIRAEGGYVLLPPSNHLSGNKYKWLRDPFENEITPLPDKLAEFMIARSATAQEGDDYDDLIGEGKRNNFLHYCGSVMRAKGFSVGAIEAALNAENQSRCVPPVTDSELGLIIRSVMRYERGESGAGLFY